MNVHRSLAVMRARWRSALVGIGIAAVAIVLVMWGQVRQYTASAVVFVMPVNDASQASRGLLFASQSGLLEILHGESVAQRVVAELGLAHDTELLAQWRRGAPAGVTAESWIAAQLGQRLRGQLAPLYCAITVSFRSADARAAAVMANAYAVSFVEVVRQLESRSGWRDGRVAFEYDTGVLSRRGVAPSVESVDRRSPDVEANVLSIELGAAEADDILHGLEHSAAGSRALAIRSLLQGGRVRYLQRKDAVSDGWRTAGPLYEVDRAHRACSYLAARARFRPPSVRQTADEPIVAAVHEPAKPPVKASSPDFVLQGTIGLALVAVVGIVTPPLRERSDPRLRSFDDVGARLHARVLAVVPGGSRQPASGRTPETSRPSEVSRELGGDLRDRAIGDLLGERCNLDVAQIARIEQYHRAHHMPFGEAARALGLVGPDDVSWALTQQFHYARLPTTATPPRSEFVVLAEPTRQRARVFDQLRAQLAQSMPPMLGPGADAPALAIMSADSGEGRSHVAANLAAASSQFGHRTLLVDADVHHPMQHELFGIDGASGLLTILDGRLQTNLLQRVPGLPGLYVLPAGRAGSDPLSLLQLPVLDFLLRELGQRFDAVIVDTPPFTRGPAAMKIAQRCGAALVIGRIGIARLRVLDRLMEGLAGTNIRSAGFVVNQR
jgi:Mrp family chromosome partitioning ATPase